MPPLVNGKAEGWPRLPALEFLLARARRLQLAARDWREQLRPGLAAAGVVAAAQAQQHSRPHDPTRHHWLATPVHWTAGMDTVRLHPQGLLTLDASEATQLAMDYARVFAGSGWELAATGGRELLFSGAPVADCQADDPALWCGQSPKAGMARGRGARILRQLGAEMEMWLHEHPVNRRRTAAGSPSISALWLWGNGPAPASVAADDVGMLLANDLYARSWWQLCGAPRLPLPVSWSQRAPAAAALPAGRQTVVLPWTGDHPAALVPQLEEHWLGPLLADWRARRIDTLRLIAGRDEFVLAPAARWRLWQRTRPWWESLLA
jgi:hypothetical protein